MDILIDFSKDIEENIIQKIDFVWEELEILFGEKSNYTISDRDLAMQVLQYVIKSVQSPRGFAYFAKTLDLLKIQYASLFLTESTDLCI